MDQRTLLPDGYKLTSENRTYIIDGYVGAGSNSIVYRAFYYDTYMPEHRHIVLLKELFPLEPQGRITRDDNFGIAVKAGAEDFYEYHKKSFITGNHAHLTLSEDESRHIAENLDSFEANRTVYTVLTSQKRQVLSELQKSGFQFLSFTDTLLFIQDLLKALQPFHSHALLHLDISPDNIFVLAPEEREKQLSGVLLLDFNSVYFLKDDVKFENQYYLGKAGYMAPEVVLHKRKQIGPWTDLYSVCILWYEILADQRFPEDRELMRYDDLISPYSRLLLHEKERSAIQLNEILKKGLQIVPKNRYQSAGEMLGDVETLYGIVTGALREPAQAGGKVESAAVGRGKRWQRRGVFPALALGVFLLGGASGGWLAVKVLPNLLGPGQSMEQTKLDLTRFPLETDDSVVLTEKNIRHSLPQNILELKVQTSMSVRVTLKDYIHPRDTSEVFETYSIYSVYGGEADKRGWQSGDLFYDFFFTPDNVLHMEQPLQDTNDFNLEYIGVIFANENYTETSALLDIKNCTLTDGAGNVYEITELEGSHVLYFDEENWQWNLLTTQNQDFVKTFADIRGGKLTVDAEVGFLDPILEVSWESDRPDIAEVDERGRVFAKAQGQATVTVTVTDRASGEVRRTQMLVNVKSALE